MEDLRQDIYYVYTYLSFIFMLENFTQRTIKRQFETHFFSRKVRSVQDTFETTDFFTDFLKTWNEVITEQSEKQNTTTTSIDVTNVFCLGLGSFAQNSNLTSLVASRYQLAFLLSWIKILKTTATTPQTTVS